MRRTATRLIAAAIVLGGLSITTSLHREIPVAPLDGDPALPESPGFEVSLIRGALYLSGHTVSTMHEADLRDVAAATFPGRRVVADFKPLGLVPDYWENTTLQMLYSLAHTSSARAKLVPGVLTIRGVIVDDVIWRNQYDALRDSLPSAIEISADTIIVNSNIDAEQTCASSFKTFVSGRINFAESGAAFRSSAYPRLARIAALADTCRESVIAITGHTDNTGTESWNQQLSLKRARAVADYLVDSGIERERLLIAGSGSSEPLVENDTRYRRSLNRRIEIVMTATARPHPD